MKDYIKMPLTAGKPPRPVFQIFGDRPAELIHISRGNSKLGKIDNFSVTMGVTCSPDVCKAGGCHCDRGAGKGGKTCYADKAYNQYPNVRNAWNENTYFALFDVPALESAINAWFAARRRKVDYFRIHAAGDFATVEYAMMWYRIAEKHPETRFLAFTKQYDIVRQVPFYKLSNFSLVLSNWYDIINAPDDLRTVYPQTFVFSTDAERDSLPEKTVICPGSCVDCKACWHGCNVAFAEH